MGWWRWWWGVEGEGFSETKGWRGKLICLLISSFFPAVNWCSSEIPRWSPLFGSRGEKVHRKRGERTKIGRCRVIKTLIFFLSVLHPPPLDTKVNENKWCLSCLTSYIHSSPCRATMEDIKAPLGTMGPTAVKVVALVECLVPFRVEKRYRGHDDDDGEC